MMITLVIVSLILLGLCIGSFLNVVIYRLPIMIQRQWQPPSNEIVQSLNLCWPRSHCPHCQHQLRIWENIPVISYILLRGKCHRCKTAISLQYPLIEILTAIITLITAYVIGFNLMLIPALILTWGLLLLACIDLKHYLLPDIITINLLWLGLILSVWGIFTHPVNAILGASCGYLSLWAFTWVFKWITHKQGMGYGDFKLFAALGAWLGWSALPLIIILAAGLGAIIGIALMLTRHHGRDSPIPFGPFLAFAGWIMLLWGKPITSTYLQFIGVN